MQELNKSERWRASIIRYVCMYRGCISAFFNTTVCHVGIYCDTADFTKSNKWNSVFCSFKCFCSEVESDLRNAHGPTDVADHITSLAEVIKGRKRAAEGQQRVLSGWRMAWSQCKADCGGGDGGGWQFSHGVEAALLSPALASHLGHENYGS